MCACGDRFISKPRVCRGKNACAMILEVFRRFSIASVGSRVRRVQFDTASLDYHRALYGPPRCSPPPPPPPPLCYIVGNYTLPTVPRF